MTAWSPCWAAPTWISSAPRRACRGPARPCSATSFAMIPGGKGANQAVAAARAGGDCAHHRGRSATTPSGRCCATASAAPVSTSTWCARRRRRPASALIAVDDARREPDRGRARAPTPPWTALTDAERPPSPRGRALRLPAGDAARGGHRGGRGRAPGGGDGSSSTPRRPGHCRPTSSAVDRPAGGQPGRGRGARRHQPATSTRCCRRCCALVPRVAITLGAAGAAYARPGRAPARRAGAGGSRRSTPPRPATRSSVR